jgi:hypothetical protein
VWSSKPWKITGLLWSWKGPRWSPPPLLACTGLPVICVPLCCYLLTLVPRSRIFLPWRWRRYVTLKRRFISQDLHGATSQKTAFFIVTAVKTSNSFQPAHINQPFVHYIHFTFKMNAACSSETSVSGYKSTQCHRAEDRTLKVFSINTLFAWYRATGFIARFNGASWLWARSCSVTVL